MSEMKRAGSWIGVDIGGPNLRVAVIDDEGCLHGWISHAHPVALRDSDFIVTEADQALRSAGRGWRDVAGMGIGVAGLVDSSTGVVLGAANLGWWGVPLGGELSRRLGVPVVIEADVAASAEAEYAALPGDPLSPWLYVSVGTGIGACLIVNDLAERVRVVLNIGHVAVTGQSGRCSCGRYGCLETVASGHALTLAAAHRFGADPGHVLHGRAATITGTEVLAAALEGDVVSQELLVAAGRACGHAVASLVELLTPRGIGLGGGVITADSPYLAAMVEAIRRGIRSPTESSIRIDCALLGERSAVIGVVALARRRLATRDGLTVT